MGEKVKIAKIYSHLNGYEYMLVHKKTLLDEIEYAVLSVDAGSSLYKESLEKTKQGQILYSPKELNRLFKKHFTDKGWHEFRVSYYVNEDLETTRNIVKIREPNLQKKYIEDAGFQSFMTYNQIDFIKDNIAVEVQFGKYFAVQYDLHVKHTFFYERGDIDVGVEIIPMHSLMRQMSFGVAWYENELTNIVREGRSNPSVPIVLMGVEP